MKNLYNMHIAYILPSLANRGPVKVVYELVQQLQDEHNIEIFYFTENNELDFDVPTYHISFFQDIDFDKYDIIHTHGIRPDAYIFFHNKKIKKAKTITTLHNYVKEDLHYQYNALTSFLFSFIWNVATSRHDQIITLTQHAKEYYLDFWFNKNIEHVYNGIPETIEMESLDDAVKKKIYTFKESNFRLLGAVGLLTKRKGFDQIVKALSRLPKYALVIVGNGKEEENLKKLSVELNVSNRVLFLGFEPNITAVIDMIDMIIVPSRSEGFSLVIQEAARQEKTVLCSDLPVFHELFSKNEVIFFTVDDIDMLKSKVEIATENNTDFIYNLHRKFLAAYTSEQMARNYLVHYRNILENP